MTPSPAAITLEDLPRSLREVAEYCGIDVALALVKEFGGGRIWIPGAWTSGNILNRLGEDAAHSLISAFANSSMDIPRSHLTPLGRRRVILQLHAEDMLQRDIARQLGCTQRVVSAMLNATGPLLDVPKRRVRKVDPRQIDIEDLLK
ncbi:MAG TPA: hypothetical protein VIQ29_04400 [Ancylobacter sp.]